MLWLGTEEQFEFALPRGLNRLVRDHLALSSPRDWERQSEWINQMFGDVFHRSTTDRPAFIWTTPIWKILPRPSLDEKRWAVEVKKPAISTFLGPYRTPTLQALSVGVQGRVKVPLNKLDLPHRRGIREQVFTQHRERIVLDQNGRPFAPLRERRLALGHPCEDDWAISHEQLPMQRMLFNDGGGAPYIDAISIDIGKLYNTSDRSTALVKRSSFCFDREAKFLGIEESRWPFEALVELHPELRILLTQAVIQLQLKKPKAVWLNAPHRSSRLAM